METVEKSGYTTDGSDQWGTGNYQHISDEDTDDESTPYSRAAAAAAVAPPPIPTTAMQQKAKVRKELDDLLQKIKLQVAKYILKEHTLEHIDPAIWEKVKKAGTKHYKAEIAEFEKNKQIMTDLRKKHRRTRAEEEQLQHLETRLHHEKKRLRRGSFVQNMEERIADINKLFDDGDDKIAIGYAKWLNAMLNKTLHGRDMRDYKGGKRKRRTRKVRHRRKRRKRKTRRRKRTRWVRKKKYRTRRKRGGANCPHCGTCPACGHPIPPCTVPNAPIAHDIPTAQPASAPLHSQYVYGQPVFHTGTFTGGARGK